MPTKRKNATIEFDFRADLNNNDRSWDGLSAERAVEMIPHWSRPIEGLVWFSGCENDRKHIQIDYRNTNRQ